MKNSWIHHRRCMLRYFTHCNTLREAADLPSAFLGHSAKTLPSAESTLSKKKVRGRRGDDDYRVSSSGIYIVFLSIHNFLHAKSFEAFIYQLASTHRSIAGA